MVHSLLCFDKYPEFTCENFYCSVIVACSINFSLVKLVDNII